MENKSKIAIVGGGLVGSLCACYFGKRGYDVHLYEYREDIRKCELVQGRSINLALSTRGREALKGVDLEKSITEYGIPMYGRMIHDTNGRTRSIPYDPVLNRCIYSVGRKYLNEILLTEAEKDSNVHFHFERKLINVNFTDNKMTFKKPNGALVEEKADLIIGADGAYSAVRNQMIKREMVNYSQTYIKHGYMELCIPPENDHMMAANHLHIWPRGGFMMIALPNQDKSWTVTLFMPHQEFARIDNEKAVLHFFHFYFPDALDIIGQDLLVSTFLSTKPSFLLSVKCSPYHVDAKAVIIGDAAHAMVPFFGQGMNAGFEDVRLLDDILHNYGYSVGDALRKFSNTRNPNAEAICDLAMYNYVEMRDLVNRPSFLFRKYLDNVLYRFAPSFWIPLYQSVTFSSMDYKNCISNKKWQDSVLRFTFYCLVFLCVCTIFVGSKITYFEDSIMNLPSRDEL